MLSAPVFLPIIIISNSYLKLRHQSFIRIKKVSRSKVTANHVLCWPAQIISLSSILYRKALERLEKSVNIVLVGEIGFMSTFL